MKNFNCGKCGNRVFFLNSFCISCQADLGFLPGELKMATFAPPGKDASLQRIDAAGLYRRCGNHKTAGACNWMVAADCKNVYCLSCRLNHIIPDLSKPANSPAWLKLENAKRRLIYGLLSLGLPVCPKEEDPATGLAFDFLEDVPAGGEKVFTGHADGLITINLVEADDSKREKARLEMGEMYRTLLGHFRHEIGHYYWDLLVDGGPHLQDFRSVFGDDTVDYQTALSNHYAKGAPRNWQQNHVSAYAAAHPWEDWAETWAHYMHIMDTLETAAGEGMVIRKNGGETVISFPLGRPFAEIARQWQDVSLLLNGLNRSMGLADPYPFILADKVIQKLTRIHDWIAQGVHKPVPSVPSASATPLPANGLTANTVNPAPLPVQPGPPTTSPSNTPPMQTPAPQVQTQGGPAPLNNPMPMNNPAPPNTIPLPPAPN